MVGRVEGERSLSNEPTSETVFMRVIQNAGSNSFNPKAFLEDAGILCQRKDATATYNPTSGTLEMTDVLTYLRAVAEQHMPDVYDAANDPETGIYSEGKQLTPEEKRAAVQTLLLLTESSEDLQASLKESEIRQVEMGINDLFEINGPLWDQENADSLLNTETRRSIGQAVASLPEEQINAQMAAYIKEKPAFVLKDILVRSMNQDAAGNTGRTITPEQLKAYLIVNPLDVFKFNNGLVSQTDKDIRKTVVWGAESVHRKTIQSLVRENPLFALQTGEGMLETPNRSGKDRPPIPGDTSKIIIEAMKALTPEQVKAHLTANPANPLDILKVVPANLSYLKPETLAALKEEAGKLRFKLRGAKQTEETPTGPAAQAQPAAGTPQTAASPEASTTIPPELADLIKHWQELGVPPERIEAYLAQRRKTDATLAENIARLQEKQTSAEPASVPPETEPTFETEGPHDQILEVPAETTESLSLKYDAPLEEIPQPAETSEEVSIYNPSPEEVKEYASKQWAEWGGLEENPNFERDTREFFEKMITYEGYVGFPMNPQGMTDQEKELYAVYKEMAPKLGYSLGELQYDPNQEMGMAKISKIETETASVATPIIEDWQSQLRQRVDKENLTQGKEISQSFIDFVQSLLNQGISHDKIAAEIGHYKQEKKSTTVALAETNQAVSTASTRQEITLGKEAIGTSPEGLLNRVNQDLTRSASSKISFMANPEAVIDYLKTIDLPLGSKIQEANTQIRNNQLSIRGVVGTKAGRLEFDVTYMQNPDGKLVVVGEPTIKTDWKLNLALKAKGYDIKDTIAHLDQIMAVKINQKVDPRWEYAGFRIAGNKLALDFKKK